MKKVASVLIAILAGCLSISWGLTGQQAVDLEGRISALEQNLEEATAVSITPFLGIWEGKRRDGVTIKVSVEACDEFHADIRIDIYDVEGTLYASSSGIAQALPLKHLYILLAESEYAMV